MPRRPRQTGMKRARRMRGRRGGPRGGGLGGNSTRTGTTLRSVTGGFPDKARVRLQWAQLFTEAAFAGTTRREYLGNSVFDPAGASGTDQPTNFDLYAAAYAEYRVWGSEIEIVAGTIETKASGTGSDTPVRIAITPFNATQTLSITDAWTNPRAKIGFATSAKPLRIKSRMSTPAMVGIPAAAFPGQGALDAAVTASPSDLWYWSVTYASLDGSTNVASMTIQARVTYDVEFFNRVPVDVDLVARVLKNKLAFQNRKSWGQGRYSVPSLPIARYSGEAPEYKGRTPSDDRTEHKKTGESVPSSSMTTLGASQPTSEDEDWDVNDSRLATLLEKAKGAAAAGKTTSLPAAGTRGLSADDFLRLLGR